MKKSEATAIATAHGIPLDVDFFALSNDVVHRILQAADQQKYRQPKNANGSRARYFHARLVRGFNQKVDEWTVQGHYGHGWEDLTSALVRSEAREDLKAYRENAPGAYRMIKRRVPV